MLVDDEARKELEATIAARRELGPEHEDHLIAGFLQRIEHRLEEREARPPAPRPHGLEMRLALGSMALGIGVTAVANSDAHGVGGVIISIIAWIAIALINVAYARRR